MDRGEHVEPLPFFSLLGDLAVLGCERDVEISSDLKLWSERDAHSFGSS